MKVYPGLSLLMALYSCVSGSGATNKILNCWATLGDATSQSKFIASFLPLILSISISFTITNTPLSLLRDFPFHFLLASSSPSLSIPPKCHPILPPNRPLLIHLPLPLPPPMIVVQPLENRLVAFFLSF